LVGGRRDRDVGIADGRGIARAARRGDALRGAHPVVVDRPLGGIDRRDNIARLKVEQRILLGQRRPILGERELLHLDRALFLDGRDRTGKGLHMHLATHPGDQSRALRDLIAHMDINRASLTRQLDLHRPGDL